MNLEDVRLFGAVAQAGSFSGAARALGVPKATLSRRVAALEASLGVELMHRSTRRLALSEAGRRLLQGSVPLLEELEVLGDDIQSLQRAPQGTLRLHVPAELLTGPLVRLLAGFSARHPGILVQCSHYLGASPRDPEAFDLTVVCYEWRLPPSDWIAVPFLSLRQGIYAAPDRAAPVPALERLQALPALVPRGETSWHFRVGDGVEAAAVTPAMALDSPLMRLQAAEQGMGIVKAPALLADAAVRAGRLVALDVPHPPLALSLALLYRSRILPARVRAFIDHLQSNLMTES